MIALLNASDWSFWAWLAQIASGVAVYASQRAGHAELTPEEELEALTMREQHPVRWAYKYPAKAVERLFR
jgi:hypothetical protein